MHVLRRRLGLLTWIALVAIWALALLPTVSHALAFAQGDARTGTDGWTEVCTPQGVKRVAVDEGGEAPLPPSGAAHLTDCPFCLLGADKGAPLPATAVAATPAGAGRDRAAASLHAPRAPHAWAGARPRAPPTVS